MTNILEIVDYSQAIANPAEAILFGLKMLLLGLGTVFLVLALIWGSIEIFRFVFNRISGNEKTITPKAEKPVAQPAPAAKDSSGEIVAVIAAAIAMAESENTGMKFKVVSFRRK